MQAGRNQLHKTNIIEITGPITKDANVSKVSGNKEVVNFSTAVNDSHRPTDSPNLL